MAAKVGIVQVMKDDLWKNNPVTVQILGICSTLAVTNIFVNTLIMGLGLIFATAFSSLTISLMRNVVPAKVRMMVQTLIIAVFVILVDIALKAYVPNISRALGLYVGLIITNCIIMGRMEGFAASNEPLVSFVDGAMSGVGYTWVLLVIAFIRELFGFGSIFGHQVMTPLMQTIGFSGGWPQWSIMIIAPGGFFMLATFLWLANTFTAKKITHSGK